MAYFCVSCVWVYCSNLLISFYVPDAWIAPWVVTYKGWIFVSVTTLLLYFVIRVFVSRLDKLHQKIMQLTFYDPLTRLTTRPIFIDRISQLLRLADRKKTCFGLIFIDINDFKGINDTYGHLVGDKVLMAMAGRLKKTLRLSDTISRFGGDEFLILTPELCREGAMARIKSKLTAALSEPFDLGGGLSLRVTASIGCALFPEHGTDLDELIRHADEDMYRNKVFLKQMLADYAVM